MPQLGAIRRLPFRAYPVVLALGTPLLSDTLRPTLSKGPHVLHMRGSLSAEVNVSVDRSSWEQGSDHRPCGTRLPWTATSRLAMPLPSDWISP